MEAGRDVSALFADVARIGPFFTVATGAAPVGGGWTALGALGEPAGVDPLRDRIAAVGAALGCDGRVAASTAFQGLAAQVVSPLIAAVAVHGVLPVPAPASTDGGIAAALHWRPGGAGPWLWWAGAGATDPCPGELLGDVLIALFTPLVAAVRARASVSPQVLWGDAASAVAAARRLVAAARPASARRVTAVAGRVLAAPPLAATAALRPAEPPDVAWTFHRRSCCLYYRVPGGGVCGDCVLGDRVPHDRAGRTGQAAGNARGRLA